MLGSRSSRTARRSTVSWSHQVPPASRECACRQAASAVWVPVRIAASSPARYLGKKCPASSMTTSDAESDRKHHSLKRSW